MKIADRFLSALSLVCRVPIKLKFNFDASRVDFWLPLIGLLPALLTALIFSAGFFVTGNKAVAVVLALIAQYLCFNLFHLDGLADTADAFLGTVNKEKRLSILKDSRTGVYGAFAIVADLILKAVMLYALLTPPGCSTVLTVFAYPISGRSAASLIPCISVPSLPDGLGALLSPSRLHRTVLGFLLALFFWAIPAIIFSPPPSVFSVSFLSAPLSAFLFAYLYKKELGGYTGDALGAAVETAELLYLFIVLALTF